MEKFLGQKVLFAKLCFQFKAQSHASLDVGCQRRMVKKNYSAFMCLTCTVWRLQEIFSNPQLYKIIPTSQIVCASFMCFISSPDLFRNLGEIITDNPYFVEQ